MNRKILLAMLVASVVLFSLGAVSASDANITDSHVASSDDGDIQLDSEEPSGEVESVNSNTLSTNNEETSLDYKNQTELTSPTTSTYYKGSYSVTLKDADSNQTLVNRTVSFIINGVSCNATTDENGVASVDLSLNPGKYTAVAFFAGDELYKPSDNLTANFEVLPTVKAKDITKYYQGSTQYSATFLDSQGNVLADRDVTIIVNGKSYVKRTNGNGVASLAINLKPGTYKVVAVDPVTGYRLTTTFKVLSTISAGTTKKIVGDSRKFTAKFLKSDGKPLANKYIKIKLKGKTYKLKTNSKGQAILSLKKLKKGTYKAICYNTDGLSKTCTVKVYGKVSTKLTANPYVFLKGESKRIKVTLKSSLGNALKSKTVKFKVNGKTYYKKTNGKGEAYLKLPSMKKGVHTVKYRFAGATHYKASSGSDKVAVITTRDVSLTVKSTKTFGHGAATPLKVAVTAGGVPVLGKAVSFKIGKASYSRNTGSSGIASLPISLDIGNYTATYSVSKDSKVNAKSASCDFKVKQRANSTLTWKSGASFSGSTQTMKVLLTDANGKPIAGQTLKLTVHSKTYTATTASNGYATFKTGSPIGTYTVSVKFAGNNDYLASSTSKSVTISSASYKKGITEKNTISDLSAYLKASKNCQVDNSKIKSLVKSLTSGLTSAYDKAQAIFNYVRDTLSYSFYYDTKYGATGALSAKRGNCVDHTHLLVAMFRTADIPARYVHGKCTFTSGSTYGHVWAQVLIGDTWICADATSSRNSLGKIANWNTKSYSLEGKYASLPF